MEVKIKLNKQMLATAKLAAIMSMPEETENINKYFNEDSEEVVDLDLSIFEQEQQQQISILLGLLVIGQKAKDEEA